DSIDWQLDRSARRPENFRLHQTAFGMNMLARAPDQAAIAVHPKTVREGPFQSVALACLIDAQGGDSPSQNLDALSSHQMGAAGYQNAIEAQFGKILQPRAGERRLNSGGGRGQGAVASRRQAGQVVAQ